MLNLYFKRAKIFLHTTKEGHALRYNAIVSASGPVPVPSWVKETLTYKCGVKDKSILDLSPVAHKPAQAEIDAEAKAYVVGSTGGADKDAAVMAEADPAEEPDETEEEAGAVEEPVEKRAKRTAAKHGIK